MALLPLLFCFLAFSITRLNAQGTAEGCVTCAFADFFKTGLEEWILPAAGTLQFLLPDPALPDPTTPKNEPDKQWTNNLPGISDQADIQLEVVEKCDPNGLESSKLCAEATAQIVWPLPVSCGDEAQASQILNEINRVSPTGRVRPFHNKCGTWFFTASLTPSQIKELMDKNIGIKFIEPDLELEDDMKISSKVQRRQPEENLHFYSQLRVRKRVQPDFIHVLPNAPLHKRHVSTAPRRTNENGAYAWFDSAGAGVTVYWIDRRFYLANPDLEGYVMSENRLMAEEITPSGREWTETRDHGGCALSVIGGSQYGLIPFNPERRDGPRLKIVRVNPRVSSFFSGIEAIINELELRTQRNERVRTYTVIGTAMGSSISFGSMLQIEAAVLFKILTTHYEAVVVVSSGSSDGDPAPESYWPSNIARDPNIPIINVAGARYYITPPAPSVNPFITLNAPSHASCMHNINGAYIQGLSPAVAIVTALAADMLTRPKVRAKLFIDINPALAPESQRLEASRPVSAKIRDYLDSLAYDRWNLGLRGVWNGLDPEITDINQYMA